MDRRPSTGFGTTEAHTGALTREEVDALLREPLIADLATITDDGYPHIVEIWTEWDGTSIWLLCRAKAAFVAHLRARPKVGLLVARRDAAQTRVLILGEATVTEGSASLDENPHLREVALRMALRYSGEAGARYIDASASWPRCLVRITPDRMIGWGDVDWHPRYR